MQSDAVTEADHPASSEAKTNNKTDETTGADQPAGQAGQGKKRRRRRRRGGRKRSRRDGDQPKDQEPSQPAEKTGEPNAKGDTPSQARSGRRRSQRPRSAETVEKGESEKPSSPERPSESQLFAETAFQDLGLRNSVLKGVAAAGFDKPTVIQAQLIPPMLEGRDILGQARTGSGKTAAFGLPMFHSAQRALPFQSLVLVPTRELAIQISGELTTLGKFTPIRVAAVYGGQAIPEQRKQLQEGPEIVVATPGRLLDLLNRRDLHLNNVRLAVLDEVDRMLGIGFRDDIRKILGKVKTDHQTVFVSATISAEIESLARSFMRDPQRIVAVAGSLTVDLVEQHYLAVEPWDKKRLLVHLLTHEEPALTLVFCRTKRTVDDLARFVRKHGIEAQAIHGDMPQNKRNSVMNRFRGGQLAAVIASDLAARGLDVEGISHVVNYDLPEDPEVYVHRIGRTARAGRGGVAWSLVTPEQGGLLTAIEDLATVAIPTRDYAGFEPGPIPEDVRKQREHQRRERGEPSASPRLMTPSLPAAGARGDRERFPQGLIPTKQPPRHLGGRVRTARSMKLLSSEKASEPDE